MAATMAATLALSRPSEKFGTHSTSVDITQKDIWRGVREATGGWVEARFGFGSYLAV
jgi:hypothetical protein